MYDQQRVTTLSGVYNSGVFRLWAPAVVLEQRARKKAGTTPAQKDNQPPPIPSEPTLWIDATVELSICDPDFSLFDREQSVLDPRAFLRSIRPMALRYLHRPFWKHALWKHSRLWAAVAGFVVTAAVCGLVLLLAAGDPDTTVTVPKTTPPQAASPTQASQVALAAPKAPVVVNDQQVRAERPAPQPPAVDPRPEPERTMATAPKKRARRARRHTRHLVRRRSPRASVDVDALLKRPRRASRSRSRSRSSKVDVDAILVAGALGSR